MRYLALLVMLLFVLFRSPDLLTASNMFAGLAGQTGLGALWPASTLVPIAMSVFMSLVRCVAAIHARPASQNERKSQWWHQSPGVAWY